MKLPADVMDWHGWHANKFRSAAWRAFEKYEKCAEFDENNKQINPRADQFYRDYLRLSEQCNNIERVVNEDLTNFP